MKVALWSWNYSIFRSTFILFVRVAEFQNIDCNWIRLNSDILYTQISKFCALISYFQYISSKELKNGKLVNSILKYLSILGWVWGGCGDANPGYLGLGRLCQNFLWKWPKFPSVEIIFKLLFDITNVQLIMHHNYFEWAPCIETFAFFSKCDTTKLFY